MTARQLAGLVVAMSQAQGQPGDEFDQLRQALAAIYEQVMRPYWQALHGIDQPDRPTAADAIAVLTELGFNVRQLRWQRPYQMIGESGIERLRRVGRRLCLQAARHEELGQVLLATPPPRDRMVLTLWWETS